MKPNLSPHSFDNLLNNVETKTATSSLARIGSIRLREPFENMGLEFCWYTRSMVSDQNANPVDTPLTQDLNFCTVGRELNSI